MQGHQLGLCHSLGGFKCINQSLFFFPVYTEGFLMGCASGGRAGGFLKQMVSIWKKKGCMQYQNWVWGCFYFFNSPGKAILAWTELRMRGFITWKVVNVRTKTGNLPWLAWDCRMPSLSLHCWLVSWSLPTLLWNALSLVDSAFTKYLLW